MNPRPVEPALRGAAARRERASEIDETLEAIIVDDDEDSRELIAIAVASYGFRCRVAVDGVDALRLLAERPADIVISDWDMPLMTGGELCRRLRSVPEETPYTYFIIMTTFDDDERLRAGMKAGADDFQGKPVRLDELEARLLSAGRIARLHRRLGPGGSEVGPRDYAASQTDALTGAFNRFRLNDDIAIAISRAQRYGTTCSLAICDLDRFEWESSVRAAGDAELRSIAGSLRANLRSADALFRYSQDELAVLLVEQERASAVGAMDRVCARIERLGLRSAGGGHLTLSAGVAELNPAVDTCADTWIARASAALIERRGEVKRES